MDWQISYEFGAPTEVTPESPRPGYDKDGKRIIGEKAISPPPEGSRWNWRTLLANTTVTFGINNIADTRPPLQVAAGPTNFFQGFDTTSATLSNVTFIFRLRRSFSVSRLLKFEHLVAPADLICRRFRLRSDGNVGCNRRLQSLPSWRAVGGKGWSPRLRYLRIRTG